ncbi:hypothetical protein [Actinosynnema mirum]|uniref:hypothetical protein n=1 Tax=Actinosynnema mirum TaxID=40567 RepID=UPI0005A0B807|nr:hypothetical protein [Actinosynnema mirum]
MSAGPVVDRSSDRVVVAGPLGGPGRVVDRRGVAGWTRIERVGCGRSGSVRTVRAARAVASGGGTGWPRHG